MVVAHDHPGFHMVGQDDHRLKLILNLTHILKEILVFLSCWFENNRQTTQKNLLFFMKRRPKGRFAIVLRMSDNQMFSPIAGYLEGVEYVWQPSGRIPAAGSHRRKSIDAPASSMIARFQFPFIVPPFLDDVKNREFQLSDSLLTHGSTVGISCDDLYTDQCLVRESGFRHGDEGTIDLFPNREESNF
jgi:hypothetical protein